MMKLTFEHYDTERLNAIPITGVARRLGLQLKRAGSVYKTLCPWHEDHTPSLTLYERTGENHCKCFACGRGGDVIAFVMQAESWSFQEACQWLSQQYSISTTPVAGNPIPRPKPQPQPEAQKKDFTYIPAAMLDDLVSTENSLCRCLMHMFPPQAVAWMVEEYRIGCYAMNGHDDYTVFPNIDHQGRVCNLKVQRYDTDTLSPRFAHSEHGTCYWLGSIWSREGRLPKETVFQSACLFGEHLLPRYPGHKVALVESPKNALFGVLAFPELVWVATGNKGQLKREVLQPLQGRDVIVIPDCDAVEEWSAAIATMTDIANFTVSDFCQRMAPEGEPKFDIADYLQQHVMPF